ncbi:cation transporter [Mycobacterium sp.]|uniref:cation transporter n=1 Tax=Mycobacterium sp. TaxID=1785 RepID=UPI0025DEF3BF|nr:cation transporter [Mycobacterium sp.]
MVDACCAETGHGHGPTHDSRWRRGAQWAYRLAWVSMVAMLTEGVVGLWQGLSVGSIALTGWALGSLPEALASAMVAWRFSGSRTASATAERRAQVGVAWSFWLTAPYIAAESVHHILERHDAETSVVGIVLTAASLVLMPILGRAKHSLAERLGSAATAGEGTQNYLCGAQAAAVLVGLAVAAIWPGVWWFDPAIGLGIAATAIWQGVKSWRGEDCC